MQYFAVFFLGKCRFLQHFGEKMKFFAIYFFRKNALFCNKIVKSYFFAFSLSVILEFEYQVILTDDVIFLDFHVGNLNYLKYFFFASFIVPNPKQYTQMKTYITVYFVIYHLPSAVCHQQLKTEKKQTKNTTI
jgi:hypothetical protein